jgi:NTP pyrophosphatase (non-canonical NTP hydrolase)
MSDSTQAPRDEVTLKDLQVLVDRMEREHGFIQETTLEKCLLMGEEVGELYKAVRKASGIKVDPASRIAPIGEELVDILFYLCAIANRSGVELEACMWKKIEKNRTRRWEVMAPQVPQ